MPRLSSVGRPTAMVFPSWEKARSVGLRRSIFGESSLEREAMSHRKSSVSSKLAVAMVLESGDIAMQYLSPGERDWVLGMWEPICLALSLDRSQRRRSPFFRLMVASCEIGRA